MRIAYCIDCISMMGGIERITLAKANALSKIDGNEVYIIVAYNKGIPVLDLEPRVRIINLGVNYGADMGLNRIQSFIMMLRKRNEHKKKLISCLQDIKPDILISTHQSEKFFIKSLSLGSTPKIVKEIHYCSEFRQLNATNIFEVVLSKLRFLYDYKWRMGAIDCIVLLTNEDKQRHWKNNPRAIVIPNPITALPNVPSTVFTEKRVIAAGRLVYQKNFTSLINAWKYVVVKHPDWILDIYGDGALKDYLEKQIKDLNLHDSVFLQGRTNDIFEKMSSSSIYALSSIYEGFALVLVEAMSCGLPVVSYACPCGPKDIIEEGKDGFLVEVNDEQTLAARINQLIEDEELRRQMSKAALQKSEKYKMERIIPMWMDLFEKLKREKG